MRKGIILSGGLGTRLFPLTLAVVKQLLPIYDKPMIYYPLSTLLALGIKDILIISTEKECPNFQKLFGDGSEYGLNIQYKVQKKPNGIAESLILAEKFLDGNSSILILGDNLFLGELNQKNYLSELLASKGAVVFTSIVKDPERYGVIYIDNNNKPIKIIEKPLVSTSQHAITGLYFYDSCAPQVAKKLNPSKRGELEITDLNNYYLMNSKLTVANLDKNCVWLDAGTIDSLYEATEIVKAIEKRTGKKIGCFEEICLNLGYIKKQDLKKIANKYTSNNYGDYLKNLCK
jgi:glucose-1-phosphate thymidylyltransferase